MEDKNCNNAESNKNEFDLDEVLKILKFGRFQIITFLLISVPIFIAGVQYSYIFTAGIVNYRLLSFAIFFTLFLA